MKQLSKALDKVYNKLSVIPTDRLAEGLSIQDLFESIFEFGQECLNNNDSLDQCISSLGKKGPIVRLIAERIVDVIYSIDNGINQTSYLLAKDVVPLSIDEVCRMRSGIEFLLVDMVAMPVYAGDLSVPVAKRQSANDILLGEYLKKELTASYLKRFDVFLKMFCDNALLPHDLLPLKIRSSHWWWNAAAQMKEIKPDEVGEYDMND